MKNEKEKEKNQHIGLSQHRRNKGDCPEKGQVRGSSRAES